MYVVAKMLDDTVYTNALFSEFQSNLTLLSSLNFLGLIKTFYNRHYNMQRYTRIRDELACFAWNMKYHTYWHPEFRRMAKLTHQIPEFDFLLITLEKQRPRLDPISGA
jgi:hypothetical protein